MPTLREDTPVLQQKRLISERRQLQGPEAVLIQFID
jgi:hypothetical protein